MLFWSGFILLELIEAYFYYGKLENLHDYAGSYLINLGLFYAIYYLVAKELLKPGSVLKIILLFIPLIFLYMLAKKGLMLLFDFARLPYLNLYTSRTLFIVLSLDRGLRFVTLAVILRSIETTYQVKLHAKELKIRKLEDEGKIRELEIANLQSKMNPHLLFNTLSIIHNAALRGSEQVARLIELLSEIMAFSLKKPGPDGKIPLNEELLQIQLQAELHKLRTGNELSIKFDLNVPYSSLRIIPASLSSLTENLFKHALIDHSTKSPTIKVVVEQGSLKYYSLNKKQRNIKAEGFRLGVETLKKRLEHYYPQEYELHIRESEDDYEVELCINL